MHIIKYGDAVPQIGENCFFAETATVVGDVTIGDECSIWFNAVIRGDVNSITIGNRTNVQDNACVHVTGGTGPTVIGDDVSIGHNAVVHGCTIHNGALIGMGAIVLDKAEIGEGAVIAAGAVVLQGTKVGAHEIWGGIPAKYIKPASPRQAETFAQHYLETKKHYLI